MWFEALFLLCFLAAASAQNCASLQVDERVDGEWRQVGDYSTWCDPDTEGELTLYDSRGIPHRCSYTIPASSGGQFAVRVDCGGERDYTRSDNNCNQAKAEALCAAQRSYFTGDDYRVRSEADGRPHETTGGRAVFNC